MESISRWFDPISAGTWPDWIAAAFTSLAFMVAALSYARSVKNRREEQARLVYSSMTNYATYQPGQEFPMLPHGARIGNTAGGALIVPGNGPEKSRHIAIEPVLQITAVVHNRSNELIGPVKLQLVDQGLTKTLDSFAMNIAAVEPESDYVVDFVFPNEHHPGEPSIGTTVLFRDATGTWWRRHLAEQVERVHNDPENSAPTPAEWAQYAANARALGMAPSPEPKVPLPARLHRAVRRMRGKPPLP